MRFIGAHAILSSRRPEADRAFLRDVLGLRGVDVGGGWLIFGLPPAEMAVHPSEKNDVHELYLMCDNVARLVGQLERHGVRCDPVQNLGWGLLTRVALPGGGRLGIYQPRHARPKPIRARLAAKKAGRGRGKIRKRPAAAATRRRSARG